MSPSEMQGAATTSLQAGKPEQALALADALLARNPDDLQALVTRSRALRDLGREDEAVEAGRAAWRVAETETERYAAAMVTAQALSSRGNKTMSQLWLRRAIEIAPNEELERRAIRDFRYVRARNPWSTFLSFSISPTDNVNNGSVRDEISFAGIDGIVLSPDARALSGLEVSGGVATRYTVSESRTHRTRAGVSLFYETYFLSDEAQEMAPDVNGSDFAYGSVALTFGHEWRRPEWSGPLDLYFAAAWSWYGGEPYGQTVQASVARGFALSPRNRLRLEANADYFALEPNEEETDRSRSLELKAWWIHAFPNGGALSFSLSQRESWSERDSLDYSRSRLEAGYTLPEPILQTRATLGFELERRDYDEYPFELDGRHDHSRELRADFTFVDLDYYGFVPTLRLFSAETLSTADRYDTRESGIKFGFRSAF